MGINSLLPQSDTDFWWQRYMGGILIPLLLIGAAVFSFTTGHSYAIWASNRSVRLVPVQGEQACLMGSAYLGFAIALFAGCYAQYHEKMGFYYERILAPGILLAGAGTFWCSWIFLSR